MLEAHNNEDQNVVKAAEACSSKLVDVFPSELAAGLFYSISEGNFFHVNRTVVGKLAKLVMLQRPEPVSNESQLHELASLFTVITPPL